MSKKKLNMSIAGLFEYLMNDVDLEEMKTQTARIPAMDKKLDMVIQNQEEVRALLHSIREMINNANGGPVGDIIVIEGEKTPIEDLPKNEEGETFIELEHNTLIPGSVSVEVNGKQIDDYTVNHFKGEITLGKDVKGEVQYTYKYLSEAANDRELLNNVKFEEVEFTKSLTTPFPYVIPTSKDTAGKIGDLAYVKGKFRNSSELKDFAVDAVQVESTYNYVVIAKSLFGKGASNKVMYFSEVKGDPLAFVIPEDTNLGKFGEYWVEDVEHGNLTIKNTGSDGDAKILVATDPTGRMGGKANFAPENGSKVSHNLKLNPKEYTVLVQSIENSEGSIGEIWIEKDKDSFTVHNTGSAETKFNYLIIEG